MGASNFNIGDEDIKKWLHHIAFICLSEDFQKLKNELESLYQECGIKDFKVAAFQDALYAFLAEQDNTNTSQSGVF